MTKLQSNVGMVYYLHKRLWGSNRCIVSDSQCFRRRIGIGLLHSLLPFQDRNHSKLSEPAKQTWHTNVCHAQFLGLRN